MLRRIQLEELVMVSFLVGAACMSSQLPEGESEEGGEANTAAESGSEGAEENGLDSGDDDAATSSDATTTGDDSADGDSGSSSDDSTTTESDAGSDDGEATTTPGDGDGDETNTTTGDGDGDGGQAPVALVFSAMGDVPYGEADNTLLPAQIAAHNQLSPSSFMVHLGDIKAGSSPCIEPTYQFVSSTLVELLVPTYVIIGDNEWNDCDDPDQAWGFWQTYFADFHDQWAGAPAITTQSDRPENFAFVHSGVLLIGITLPGGTTHDQGEWDDFLGDASSWVTQQLEGAGDEIYAAVVFGHANPAAKHEPFITPFRAASLAFDRPVLYLHGDGHVWIEDQPWPETNMHRVQVDAGGGADPLQVTVDPEASAPGETFVFERDALP